MEQNIYRKVMISILLIVLIILSFFLLEPILMSIIAGILLAFIFSPIFSWIKKKINSKNGAAFLVCLILIVLIVIPLWYLTPIVVDQSIKFYTASQEANYIAPIKNMLPSFFSSESFSNEMASVIHSFVTKTTNSLMNSFTDLIMNFPTLFLQFLVVLFTFFFTLRDGRLLLNYIQNLLPFPENTKNKLFKSSKDITLSVLYGQVLLGIFQGLVVGIGFFAFGVSNALLLTLIASLAGIFPIVGTALVWVPVTVYFLIQGDAIATIGILIFGILSALIENMLKPIFISKRTKLNSSIVLIGMIGGLLMFGILGVILGPLILAYLLIVLELYKSKKAPDVFIQKT